MKCPRCGNEWDVSNPVTPPPKNIPPRPQVSSTALQTVDQLLPTSKRLQSPLRARRLVTAPLAGKDDPQTTGACRLSMYPPPASSALMAQASNLIPGQETRLLMPGIVLRRGRYRLRELRGRQEWLAGAYEAVWIAQDAQRSGAAVTICELVIPEQGTMRVQSLLRTSTMVLTSIARHPCVPTLWDAFSDQERNFFVFEPVAGESLLLHMRRTGHALPEQDVIECCLQITEVLDLLAQQNPPLVHGLIQPEHIFMSRDGSFYTLANFSVVLAGGGTQFIAGMDRSRFSPYTAPELVRGAIDIRSDLYSLLATAYHAVTGSVPAALSESIPQAQRLNPTVSSQFDAILAKGLRTSASQRYQHPSELRADLLLLQSSTNVIPPRNNSALSEQRSETSGRLHTQVSQSAPAAVSQMLPAMLPSALTHETDERRSLLPRPEELPLLEKQNALRRSLLWIAGIVLCLVVVLLLSRGFM